MTTWKLTSLLALACLAGCGRGDGPTIGANTMVLEIGGDRPALRAVLDRVQRQTAAERGERVEERGESQLSPRPRPPRFVIVREGETLSQLAQRTLGTWRRWEEIAELNAIENPNAVAANTKLRLPHD